MRIINTINFSLHPLHYWGAVCYQGCLSHSLTSYVRHSARKLVSIIYTQVPCRPAPSVDFLATVARARPSVCSERCSGCVCSCCSAGGGSGLVIMVSADLQFTSRGEAKRKQRGFEDRFNLSLPSTVHLPLLSSFSFHLCRDFPSLFLCLLFLPPNPPLPLLPKLHSVRWVSS